MIKSGQKSILEQNISPFKQMGVALFIAIILMVLSKFAPVSKYSTTSHILPWTSLCGVILFFALANSVLSLSSSNDKNYWMHSIISFAGLLVIGGFIAYGLSGVGIYDAESVSWLYVVMTFCYLVFLSIVNLIKFFVALAQKQDKRVHGDDL